jgi:hypothetical protein
MFFAAHSSRMIGSVFTDMDQLTLFGLVAVVAMLTFYAMEDRSPWFVFAFAGACVMASAYGFLQGAWPFGLVEAVWSLIALRRWWLKSTSAAGPSADK